MPSLLALLGVGCFALWCPRMAAQELSPEKLLGAIHSESKLLSVTDRMMVLYDLAIAATAEDPAISAAWALEMYDLATKEMPRGQMNREAGRKNALTILCLTDAEHAAEHYLELEPSVAHQPNEDPRIDLARHLFPRLWAKQGMRALPTIQHFAEFTSRTGQYPYVAMGHILPQVARVDGRAARSLFRAAVERLPNERGIWRTEDDYLSFLRESWPVASAKDRRHAVEAALSVVRRSVADKAAAELGSRSYAEYYFGGRTVRLESEETARVYDLLPFVDRVDGGWGRELRRQYPALANVPLPAVDATPWRSGVFVAAGRDTPERVQAAFERHHLMFLSRWAAEDSKRAAAIALTTQDAGRRRTAMAIVLPQYAKADAVQAESWREELERVQAPGDLEFLVALARANFALGHEEAGLRSAGAALALGKKLVAERDKDRPIYSAPGAEDLHDLAEIYGEFRLSEFVGLIKDEELTLRTYLLAGAARGALRGRAGYREPN